MSRLAAISSLGSEFNEFLYAAVADDGDGKRLSVLSALGRCDVDPWETASALARMPRDAAVGRLVTLLSVHSDAAVPQQSLEVTATRVIALLPVSREVDQAAVRDSSRRPALVQAYFLLAYVLTCLSFAFLLDVAQSFKTATSSINGERPATSSGVPSPTKRPEVETGDR